MKLFRMLGRSLRDAFKSVFRNFSLSLSSITCSAITLVIVAIALIATFNVQVFTKSLEDSLVIIAFVEESASEQDIKLIEEEIKQISNVKEIKYESKLEVKENIQKDSDVMNEILDTWEDDELPLMNTYQITLKEVERINEDAATIENIENISLVRYGEEYATTLISAFDTIKVATYIAVGALVIVTVFLIVNTIKLTIFSRQREISIMRLVGASNMTIKMPFIFEGMILGLLGAIVPIILATYGYLSFYNHFGGVLLTPILELIEPEPFMYKISLILAITGMVVGMIGSATAVKKYLKV